MCVRVVGGRTPDFGRFPNGSGSTLRPALGPIGTLRTDSHPRSSPMLDQPTEVGATLLNPGGYTGIPLDRPRQHAHTTHTRFSGKTPRAPLSAGYSPAPMETDLSFVRTGRTIRIRRKAATATRSRRGNRQGDHPIAAPEGHALLCACERLLVGVLTQNVPRRRLAIAHGPVTENLARY